MEDEFSLEAKIYDKIWGRSDYDSGVKFLDSLFREYHCRSVIDIGCGTGNHALRLSKIGYEVTGVDISPSMLEKAREKDRKAKVNLVEGDMRRPDRAVPRDKKFDAAICLGIAFSHLLTNNDVQTFLRGLHKILRKDGLLVFDARNAKKIGEEYLNKLLVEHVITESRLQLLMLACNTRDPRNRNIIVWRPIYLMNENGKLDFQMRERKLRWFLSSTLKKLLAQNHFKLLRCYSGPFKERFDENENATMWLVSVAK
jgi:SAM-dependent methyltransferase